MHEFLHSTGSLSCARRLVTPSSPHPESHLESSPQGKREKHSGETETDREVKTQTDIEEKESEKRNDAKKVDNFIFTS